MQTAIVTNLYELIPSDAKKVQGAFQDALDSSVSPIFILLSGLYSAVNSITYLAFSLFHFFTFDFKESFKMGDYAISSAIYAVAAIFFCLFPLPKREEIALKLIENKNSQIEEPAALMKRKNLKIENFLSKIEKKEDGSDYSLEEALAQTKQDITRSEMFIDGVKMVDADALLDNVKQLYMDNHTQILSLFSQKSVGIACKYFKKKSVKEVSLRASLFEKDLIDRVRKNSYFLDSEKGLFIFEVTHVIKNGQRVYAEYIKRGEVDLKRGVCTLSSIPLSITPFTLQA